MKKEELLELIKNKEILLKINKQGNILCNFISPYQIQTFPIEKENVKEITIDEYLSFLNGEIVIDESLNNFIKA